MGAIVYPIASSWVWGGGWLGEMGFKDFAGSAVVHELGGFGGFIGTIILKPRLGIFDESEDIINARKKRKLEIELRNKKRKKKAFNAMKEKQERNQ